MIVRLILREEMHRYCLARGWNRATVDVKNMFLISKIYGNFEIDKFP